MKKMILILLGLMFVSTTVLVGCDEGDDDDSASDDDDATDDDDAMDDDDATDDDDTA